MTAPWPYLDPSHLACAVTLVASVRLEIDVRACSAEVHRDRGWRRVGWDIVEERREGEAERAVVAYSPSQR